MNSATPALGVGAYRPVVHAALAIACVAFATSCLERRSGSQETGAEARCTSCHGDASRPGDALSRSAPPRDLRGAESPSSPGVGAHAIHLERSRTHGEIACVECHRVPEHVGDRGHADSARPAELVFGALASQGGLHPSYDPVARTCSNTWCHRKADAVWSAPHDSEQACGSCHGLPPSAPHPQSERCAACHAEVIDDARRIIAPDLHVDGRVQYTGGECTTCHGSGGNPAPPTDTSGNSAVTALGVGAHRVHLSGGNSARPLDCAECHSVPEAIDIPAHADGLPAEVILRGVAASHDHRPAWAPKDASCVDTWCHAPKAAGASPPWNLPGALSCGGCHGLPPPLPHPASTQCGQCHGDVVSGDHRTIIARARHVDGTVDVTVSGDCRACHGSENPAPPSDLSGNQSTSAPGVGAHQAHLRGTSRSRAVPCTSCHEVPETVLSARHLDGAATVTFSGAAIAFGADPTYTDGACSNTACHGAVFPEGHASGGTNTSPLWTQVGAGEAACGSCHGLPPPRPHPYREQSPDCSQCHHDIASDNQTFVRPELHVDGEVTFELP